MPCIWLLPYLLADKTFAIWVALPVSDVAAFLATIPPILAHTRFLGKVRDYRRRTIR